MGQPEFEALYYRDRLRIVNPSGDVGVVVLWTPLPKALELLDKISPNLLDPDTSRIAVVANLFGDGMYAMLCNLLYNPQVRHLVAIGADMAQPTCDELESFLREGCEDAVLLGRRVRRIRGTDRVFPASPAFDEALLRSHLTFRHLGGFSTPGAGAALLGHVGAVPRADLTSLPQRVAVQLEMSVPDSYTFSPSNPLAHQVVRRRPLDCWEELVVRVMRFGRPVTLRSGPRIELLNTKVVITEPADDPPEALDRYGFRLERFREYQQVILDASLPPDVAYTYGNRLRGHFGPSTGEDTLARAAALLREDPETRAAYISLWDTTTDLGGMTDDTVGDAKPCLTTVFFRNTSAGLSMSATYRAHNLLTAWLENAYGLMAVQRYVAEEAGLPRGPITVLSHSLGADPRNPRYDIAKALAEGWTTDDPIDRSTGRHELRRDPHGDFVVSIDEEDGTIVAEHRYKGLLVKEYRSRRAAKIEREVAADMAVSLVSHALWLGRELTAKESQLRQRGPRTALAPESTG